MPQDLGFRTFLCGSAAVLLAGGTCLAQAAQEKSESKRTVVVTQPQTRSVTRVVTLDAPPEAAKKEVRIERKVVDGDEHIELWINGEKIDVQSMEDVHKALGQDDHDVDVHFFDPADMAFENDGHMFRFGPQELELNVLGDETFAEGRAHHSPLFRLEGMKSMTPPKSVLGVRLAPISEDLREYLELDEDAGVRVEDVVDESPAAKAGLKNRDIIVAARIGSESHDSIGIDALRESISKSEPGTKVKLTVLRKGKKKEITATLSEWDNELFGMTGSTDAIIDLKEFNQLGDHHFQLEMAPDVERRIIQLKPDLKNLQFNQHNLLQDAMPEHAEMLRMMEQQMQQMQEMLDQLRQQQHQLRQQVEESATPEA